MESGITNLFGICYRSSRSFHYTNKTILSMEIVLNVICKVRDLPIVIYILLIFLSLSLIRCWVWDGYGRTVCLSVSLLPASGVRLWPLPSSPLPGGVEGTSSTVLRLPVPSSALPLLLLPLLLPLHLHFHQPQLPSPHSRLASPHRLGLLSAAAGLLPSG